MGRVLRLVPASKIASRVVDAGELLTIEGDSGPVCPVCKRDMRPIPGHDPVYVRCATSDCLFSMMPFRAPRPAAEPLPVMLSPEEVLL